MQALPGGWGARGTDDRPAFARVARRYDLVNTLASLGLDRVWRRAAVAEAAAAAPTTARDGADVLDLCAGTGELTFALAAGAGTGRLVGLDISPEMLEIAARKAAVRRAARIPVFVSGDALDLPFDDGTFDVITVAFGLRNLVDRQAAFSEALRVLRRGGRLVVLEFSRPSSFLVRAAYHAYLRTVVPLVGGLLAGDFSAYGCLRRTILGFPPPQALADEMAAAGFAPVTWRLLSAGIVAVHVGICAGPPLRRPAPG